MLTLADILAAARTPGGQAVLSRVAATILGSREQFKREHWGRESEWTQIVDVDETPRAALGALACLGYVTQKGADREPTLYLHQFGNPFPWLHSTADGGLMIVRGKSKFDVTSHGIEG